MGVHVGTGHAIESDVKEDDVDAQVAELNSEPEGDIG